MEMKQFEGFTLIALLVVIAIIGILMAILMPVLGKARKQAWAVTCQRNSLFLDQPDPGDQAPGKDPVRTPP